MLIATVLTVAAVSVSSLNPPQRSSIRERVPAHIQRISDSPVRVAARTRYEALRVARAPRFRQTMVPVDLANIQVFGQWSDLRPAIQKAGLGIRAQGSRGTCSVFALTFCQEFVTAKKTGMKNLDFSEEYLNAIGDLAACKVFDGGFYSDLDLGYQTWGHINENEMPYTDPLNPNLTASNEQLAKGAKETRYAGDFIKDWDPSRGANPAEMQKVLGYLDQGLPVAVGLLWPGDGKWKTEKFKGVEMMVVIPKSDTIDGHSVALVGYKKGSEFPGGGYFIFRNSWGSAWGAQGYGTMSFAYVGAFANDLLAYH